MVERGIDAMVLGDAANVFYVTDLPISSTSPNPVLFVLQRFSPSVVFLTCDGRVVLVCSLALAQHLENNAPWIEPRFYPTSLFIDDSNRPGTYADSLWRGIVRHVNEARLTSGCLAVDSAFKTAWGGQLTAEFPKARWVDADGILKKLRMVKTAEEITRIERATDAACAAVRVARDIVESGVRVTERSLFVEIRSVLVRESCQWNFTSVGGGINSPDIYHQPGDYEVKPGDVVRLDIGAVYQGYGTDIATTLFAPPPDEKCYRLYAVLKEAQARVIKAMKPGARASDLFWLGQEYVRSAGYHHYNRSMIGHGVGIETEEDPFISPGSDVILSEGMVFAVEIPYYIRDIAGLNTEDLVVVTANGCEPLSTP
jgi:Xaa-Pro aminopeptidase